MDGKETTSLYRADPDAVWKETVRNEINSVIKWEEEWSYLIQQYKKLQEDLEKEDICRETQVVKETDKTLPEYPKTTSKHIGWLLSKPEFNLEKYGKYTKPVGTLYKVLDWPVEGCP